MDRVDLVEVAEEVILNDSAIYIHQEAATRIAEGILTALAKEGVVMLVDPQHPCNDLQHRMVEPLSRAIREAEKSDDNTFSDSNKWDLRECGQG